MRSGCLTRLPSKLETIKTVIRLFLILPFLVSCGRPPAGDAYLFTRDFARLALDHNRYVDTSKVSISVAPLNQLEQLDCEHNRVTINQETWDTSSVDRREAIVFHVLGHCLLKRDHRDGVDNAIEIGAPWSLMNSGFAPGYIYRAHEDYYHRELFSPVPQTVRP